MECKFCGAQMPEQGNFCPMCGRDNSQPEESVLESEVQVVPAEEELILEQEETEEFLDAEVKQAKRKAAIVGCFAVLAVLALALFLGIRGNFFGGGQFRENDIFKQDSYTVTDSDADKKDDVVVATLGSAKLTNSQLQIYYQMEIDSFLTQLGSYLSYLGLDYTKPLDQQYLDPENVMVTYILGQIDQKMTWQQYFLEGALLSWQQSQVLALEAEKADFSLDAATREYLDSLEDTLQQVATQNGFATVDALMHDQFGANTELEDWEDYLEVSLSGYQYYNHLCNTMEIPDVQTLAAFFQEYQADLEAQGIKQDGSYPVDVRHILIAVEGGTENDDGTITFPEEALAQQALAEAERILNLWLENPTEENFGALALEYTADGNGSEGGLYTGVAAGKMVRTFNDWCFDPQRQVGDYGIVETRFGYHIMYFSARGEEYWLTNTREVYMSQQQSALLEAMMAQYELKVSYGKIALANVDLT